MFDVYFLTWYHVTEAHSAQCDEGIVDTIDVVPVARLIILQRSEDSSRYQHEEGGEEEDKHDSLNEDYNHLGLDNLLVILSSMSQTLPQFLFVLFKLNKQT